MQRNYREIRRLSPGAGGPADRDALNQLNKMDTPRLHTLKQEVRFTLQKFGTRAVVINNSGASFSSVSST